MQKVIDATEASGFYLNHDYTPDKSSPTYISDSICFNACKMADLAEAVGIVVFSFGGGTVLKIASHRPGSKIFAFTSGDNVMKQSSIVRGVSAFQIGENIDINDAIDQASEMLRKKGLVNKGDKLVFVAGIPMPKREPVNMVKISIV